MKELFFDISIPVLSAAVSINGEINFQRPADEFAKK